MNCFDQRNAVPWEPIGRDEMQTIEGGIQIPLRDVYVTSYQTGGSAADDAPVESLSLNYGRISIQYVR